MIHIDYSSFEWCDFSFVKFVEVKNGFGASNAFWQDFGVFECIMGDFSLH